MAHKILNGYQLDKVENDISLIFSNQTNEGVLVKNNTTGTVKFEFFLAVKLTRVIFNINNEATVKIFTDNNAEIVRNWI